MIKENPRILSLLSLCMKAGRLKTGETIAEKLLRSGGAQLLIIAGDASDNTKKKFINKCFYYKKPILVYSDRDVLSKSVGRQNRTVFVIIDANFAKRLESLISMEVAECQKPAYTN